MCSGFSFWGRSLVPWMCSRNSSAGSSLTPIPSWEVCSPRDISNLCTKDGAYRWWETVTTLFSLTSFVLSSSSLNGNLISQEEAKAFENEERIICFWMRTFPFCQVGVNKGFSYTWTAEFIKASIYSARGRRKIHNKLPFYEHTALPQLHPLPCLLFFILLVSGKLSG